MSETPPSLPPALQRLLRADLRRDWKPYTPVVPTEFLGQRAGVAPEQVIKLDANENPYGPSPRVLRALAEYREYHIYPDPYHLKLREALAGYAGLPADRIVVGNGSDEVIDLLMRTFLEPGDRVITCEPTFGMYSFNAWVCGAEAVDVPRDACFAVDVDAVRAAMDERVKLICIASPNNPSGNVTPEADIRALLETGALVIVDEAYQEFSDTTLAPLTLPYNNLAVLRTFSKWAGLAGLRVGYGLMAPALAAGLYTLKPPYNVSVAAQVAAIESLNDQDYLRARVRDIVAERARLFAGLQSIPYLEVYASQANFILCRVVDRNASDVVGALEAAGIFIRQYNTPRLHNWIRVSVGRPEHTDALLAVLRRLEHDRG